MDTMSVLIALFVAIFKVLFMGAESLPEALDTWDRTDSVCDGHYSEQRTRDFGLVIVEVLPDPNKCTFYTLPQTDDEEE